MREPIRFNELIAPLSRDDFFRDVYGQTAAYFAGRQKRFSHLFSWETFNQLLSMSTAWSDKTTKLVRNGRALAPEEYCQPVQSRDGHAILAPSASRIKDHLSNGATLVLELTERLSPGLSEVADAFQMAFGAPVACNIYCSWEGHRGFPPHFDTMDVFALQIEGEKTWRLFGGNFENPIEHHGYRYSSFSREHHQSAQGKVLKESKMTPGDVLYIPRGQYHDALASNGASLHLSFGITEATGLDVMQILVNSVADDVLFRAALPHFDDAESHQSHLARLSDRLARLVSAESASKEMREYQRKRALRDFRPHYQLPDRDSQPTYRVRTRGSQIERDGETVIVTREGSSTTLSGESAALCLWAYPYDYVSRTQIQSEFPAWSEAELESEVKALMDAGYLEIL